MSRLLLGINYTDTVGIEKRISYGVAQRTGGFCLPPSFTKKGISFYFAVDNIDFLENTSDGQNTIHGTLTKQKMTMPSSSHRTLYQSIST